MAPAASRRAAATAATVARLQRARRPTLPLYLAAAYTLLVIYASLHPFSGWRDTGAPITAFLFAAWPRYWTGFDLVTNVLAYLPLGFLWVPTLQHGRGRLSAAVLATALCFALSLSMETLQNFLPSRVASNLDLATNSLGGLFGALAGARWGALLLDGGRLHTLRTRLVGDGAMADAGLVLLGLWLVTQLNPEILLFGNGDLRSLLGFLGVPGPLPYTAQDFSWVEAGVVATNTLATGLFAGCLLKIGRRQLAVLLLLVALAVKSLSMMLLMDPASGWSWVTPGSVAGLGVGGTLWLAASFLPSPARQVLAVLALAAATALVNLAPENPYLVDMLQLWQQGHFLNFNGLTRIISALWPFLALPWLIMLRQKSPAPQPPSRGRG